MPAPDPEHPLSAAPTLSYHTADVGPRLHSGAGLLALAVSLVPLLLLGVSAAYAMLELPPPPAARKRFMAFAMIAGPVLTLTLAIGSLRTPRRRRWPAIVAIVMCVPVLAFLALVMVAISRQ